MEPKEIKLRLPVEWGKETVTTLTLKPTGRAYRNFSIKTTDGGMVFEPYPCALVGLKMAAQPGGEEFLDRMDIRDIRDLGEAALAFFGADRPT